MTFLLRVIPRHATTAVLLALWLIVTSFNLTKAVHIDDTAYLGMAEAFLKSPAHPLSAPFNWIHTNQPIYVMNQPLLLPLFWAGSIAVFGESEIALHFVMALFSLAAILFFYRLAQLRVPKYALWLTAIFCLGPGFLPSQNLMCDVPMLALWLLFLWAILQPMPENQAVKRYLIAGLAVGAACLIKYLSLVLLPVLCLHIMLTGRRRMAWTLALPVAILAAWSLFNYQDYGGVHLFQRSDAGGHLSTLHWRTLDWMVCLGATAPYAVCGIPFLWQHRPGRQLFVLGAGAALVSFCWSFFVAGDDAITCMLRALFLLSGLLAVGCAMLCVRQTSDELANRTDTGQEEQHDYQALTLIATLLLTTAFTLCFAPFMAVRHLLPVMAILLLLIGPVIERTTWIARSGALALTVLSGFAVGLSDWKYADLYRQQATAIRRSLPPQARIWFVGHWGWQWYGLRSGMKQYDVVESQLSEGDYLVAPHFVGMIGIAAPHQAWLQKERTITIQSDASTRVRTMLNGYGFYAGGYHQLPWTVSPAPLEQFSIYRAHKPS